MIIRCDEVSLLFMTQPDHARLSAELLARWTADGFPAHPRRAALLLAAREHDNGWREVDESPAFDAATGTALDFVSVPDEIKYSIWPRGLERIAEGSAYAAALVAQHAMSIYESHREKTAWAAFFDEMTARRDRELARAEQSPEELENDYRFLSIVDLLSLVFCNAWPDEHERFGCRVRYASAGIDISPALFPEAVPIRIRARRLPNRRYASAADLRAAFEDAPPEFIEGQARGGPVS
jgi:Protein of unknown function (DUF3891)